MQRLGAGNDAKGQKRGQCGQGVVNEWGSSGR